MPEADEQIRREAHQFPEGIKLHNVGGKHQAQHSRGEQGHVGEVAGHPRVSLHVAQGVNLDQQADAADHYQHYGSNRVQQQAHFNGGISQVKPGVRRKGQVRALVVPE